jgi:hypothetical protein
VDSWVKLSGCGADWPRLLSPQQVLVPSPVRAQPLKRPAETALNAPPGGLSRPYAWLPQQASVPSALIAQLVS